jgi:ABC-2 type transport system ATP-binding protein
VAESVISVSGLHKSYGSFEAVRGVDLDVRRGEIFAFLGPNGAGKTTTISVLEGYLERDSGTVEVLGVDPAEADRSWRGRVGFVLQECRMEPLLSVRETLDLYAGYYDRPRSVSETIELVGLADKAGVRAGKLSGGQQRRLDVAIALIGDAELLFLDEPTTGFDPSARRQTWEVISGLRDLGKTVMLTTHYMDEAQALADRVAVIAAGRIIAEGTPDDLGGRDAAACRISFEAPGAPGLAAELSDRVGGEWSSEHGRVLLSTDEPVELLNRLTAWALESGNHLLGLEVRRPSLEDIYLELTGQAAAEHPAGAPGEDRSEIVAGAAR